MPSGNLAPEEDNGDYYGGYYYYGSEDGDDHPSMYFDEVGIQDSSDYYCADCDDFDYYNDIRISVARWL